VAVFFCGADDWCGEAAPSFRLCARETRVGEFCTVLALNAEGEGNLRRKAQAFSLRETLLSTRSVRIAEFDPCHPHQQKRNFCLVDKSSFFE